MDDAIAQLVKLVDRYGDSWKLGGAVTELCKGRPDDYRGQLYWRAYRQGAVDVAANSSFWYTMSETPGEYDSALLLRLLGDIARHHPDGRRTTSYGYTTVVDEDGVPGQLHSMDELVAPRLADAADRAALVAGWRDLPEPYNVGLGYVLAQHGALPASALPDGLLDEVAKRYLRSDRGSIEQAVWSPSEWGAALVRVGREGDFLIRNMAAIEELRDCAAPDQLMAIAGRLEYGSDILDGVRALASLDDDGFAALRDVIEALPAVQPFRHASYPSHNSDHAWPPFTYLAIYLCACQGRGLVPEPDIDLRLGEVLEHYDTAWGGSAFVEYHQQLWGMLRAVPSERLERLCLSVAKLHWMLYPGVQSEALTDRCLATVASHPKLSSWSSDAELIGDCLTGLGARAIPAINKFLAGGKAFPLRGLLLEALAKFNDDTAVPGLMSLLTDSAKGVREDARQALEKRTPAVVLAALSRW